jgi:hypothetical protein
LTRCGFDPQENQAPYTKRGLRLPFEKLNVALVSFGRGTRFECAQIAPALGLRVKLSGI